jgi:uncharacterized protein (TIGR01370 family)
MVLRPSRRQTLVLLGGSVTAPCMSRSATAQGRRLRSGWTWAVFYGMNADPRVLARFDVVVLDPSYRGAIMDYAAHGGVPCGYISLGEIARTQKLMPFPSDPSVLVSENLSWPGTYRVDVRKPQWRSLVLDHGIPALLARGFAGIFLDTLDTPPYLEEVDPERYRGMRAAAIALIRSIRERYPDVPIIMNRGYALLADAAETIDAVVAESFMTTYDSATRAYTWVEPAVIAQQQELLAPARKRSPPLPIFSLDYWNPSDVDTIRRIYARERDLGHSPYVATILLDRIIAEPMG